jgi:hypothetical protein
MGPSESPTRHRENQQAQRRKRPARRPRTRRCLLKGCEQRFHPRHARQRYCSEGCREAAREWARWKAQERYRATRAGKQKRNGQSRRYRDRLRNGNHQRKRQLERSRGSSLKIFFRSFLRPAGLLRVLPAAAAKPAAAVLLAGVPACDGTRVGAGVALAPEARRFLSARWEPTTAAATVKPSLAPR